MDSLPSHVRLSLPLLQVLQEHGPLSPSEATERVADKLGLSPGARETAGADASDDRVGRRPQNAFAVKAGQMRAELFPEQARGNRLQVIHDFGRLLVPVAAPR